MYNFDLAFNVVQEYRLPSKVYATAVIKLAQRKQTKRVDELLKNVRMWFTDVEMDQCLLTLIQSTPNKGKSFELVANSFVLVYVGAHNDTSQGENYISRMKFDATKVEGYMICKKLKQAYLLAVKVGDIELIQKLKDEAKVCIFFQPIRIEKTKQQVHHPETRPKGHIRNVRQVTAK